MNNYAPICSNHKGIHKKQLMAIMNKGGSLKLSKNGNWGVEIIVDDSDYVSVKLVHKIDKLGDNLKQTWNPTKIKKVIVEKEVDKKIKDEGSKISNKKQSW